MGSIIEDRRDWISARKVALLLGIEVDSRHNKKIFAACNIRRKEIPGMDTRYYRPDVEKIAAECVKQPRPDFPDGSSSVKPTNAKTTVAKRSSKLPKQNLVAFDGTCQAIESRSPESRSENKTRVPQYC